MVKSGWRFLRRGHQAKIPASLVARLAARSRGVLLGDGFQVQIDQLGTAARSTRSAAGQLDRVHPGQDLRSAAAGVPGAASVRAMDQVAAVWQAELSSWKERAGGYAAKLEQSAAAYRGSDDCATLAFTNVDQRMR